MISDYIFGISLAFSFSIIGMLVNTAIRNKPFYRHLSNFNFIKSEKANRYFGILVFRTIVLKSFWRHFNPAIKIAEGRPNLQKLQAIRNEMTYAEISHLIAFICGLIMAVVMQITHFLYNALVPLLLFNVIFHIYPPLVQQYNKRRLDKVITRLSK